MKPKNPNPQMLDLRAPETEPKSESNVLDLRQKNRKPPKERRVDAFYESIPAYAPSHDQVLEELDDGDEYQIEEVPAPWADQAAKTKTALFGVRTKLSYIAQGQEWHRRRQVAFWIVIVLAGLMTAYMLTNEYLAFQEPMPQHTVHPENSAQVANNTNPAETTDQAAVSSQPLAASNKPIAPAVHVAAPTATAAPTPTATPDPVATIAPTATPTQSVAPVATAEPTPTPTLLPAVPNLPTNLDVPVIQKIVK